MDVERHRAIAPLLREWAALHDADDRATPYGSAAWARAWAEHGDGEGEPWCLAVRDGGRLVGLMALTRRRRASMRVLRPLGDEHADCWDVLALPEARADVERCLAVELRRRGGEWDAMVLTRLTHTSSLPDALPRGGFRARTRGHLPQPHIALPSSFEEYLERLPGDRRRQLRKCLRPLDSGRVTVREKELAELPDAVADLLALRQRQWAAAGKTLLPSLVEDRFRRFLTSVVCELAPAGQARLVELAADGEPFGLYINFVGDHVHHCYMGGFEPAHARLQPGKLHILASISSSIEAGCEWLNLGCGGESYKLGFRPEPFMSRTMAVTSARLRSRAALVAGTLSGRLR